MSRVRKPLLIISILAAASLAHADGVVIQAQVNGLVPGVPRADLQGPATSGSLLATVLMPEASSFDGLGPAFGRAAQNDAGVAGVRAEVKCTSVGTATVDSRSSWTATAINTTNRLVEFIYSFVIDAPRLALLDPSGTSAVPAEASYDVNVKRGALTLFSSQAVLRGGRFAYLLKETGTDLGGAFFGTPGSGPFGYLFAPYHGVLSLGFYQPGGSVTVVASLRVASSAGNPTTGGRAEIGDPLDLSGDPGLNSIITLGEPVAVTRSTWGAVKGMYRGQ
jgi:hypothetical protein